MSSYSIAAGLKNTLIAARLMSSDNPLDNYDVIIRFHAAQVRF
jgi:hypothetical protein